MDDQDVAKLEDTLLKVIEKGDKLLKEIQAGKLRRIDCNEGSAVSGTDLGASYDTLQSLVNDVGRLLKRTPEKQDAGNETEDLICELKAQLMKNINVQDSNLKSELFLHEKLNEVRLLHQENTRLQSECMMSRSNALKLMKMFERKAMEANGKLRVLQARVDKYENMMKSRSILNSKSTDNVCRVLDDNHDVQTTTGGADVSQGKSKYVMIASVAMKTEEMLMQENRELRLDMKRLKGENTDLLTRTKFAMSNQHTILSNLSTSEMARANMLKKLKKEKEQNVKLTHSLTRKTAEWVESKKIIQQMEEDYRWEQVGPIPTGGSKFRVPHLPTAKTLYMPLRRGFGPDGTSVHTN